MTDLDKLRELAEAATPGPWEADHREVSQHWTRPEPRQTVASHEVDCMAYCYGGTGRGIERPEDAEFIAAANPAAVTDLIDRIVLLSEALAQFCECPQPEDPEGCYCPTGNHDDCPGGHRKGEGIES